MKKGIKGYIGNIFIILTTAVVLTACHDTNTTATPVPQDLDRTNNNDTSRVLVEKQPVDTTRVVPDSVNHK